MQKEEGVVVDQTATHVKVWVNRYSRVIPVRHWRMRSTWQLGTRVGVWMDNDREITGMEEIPAKGTVTVNGNAIKIKLQLIFPPRKLLSKIGLKLFSTTIGLISVNGSWRNLFDQAADAPPAVYEATVEWCPATSEFVLMKDQEVSRIAANTPTYLSLLIKSEWDKMIEAPERAEEILQYVMDEMDPPARPSSGLSSSSSSDDGEGVTLSDFTRYAILMHNVFRKVWKIFVLDQDETRNQWAEIDEETIHRRSSRTYTGALIAIDLDIEKGFKVESWRVVDSDGSVLTQVLPDFKMDGTSEDKVMLDVAARVEKEVTIGGRKIIRLYNKRVTAIYDYHNILREVATRQVVRVIIKWSPIEGDIMRGRHEWVVHDYGKGVPALPATKKQIKKAAERKQALDEFKLVEFAGEHDWTHNDVLWNYCGEYKKVMRDSKTEEARREEERKAEIRRREEEEFIRHKLGSDAEEDELTRLKLAADRTPLKKSPGNSTQSSTSTLKAGGYQEDTSLTRQRERPSEREAPESEEEEGLARRNQDSREPNFSTPGRKDVSLMEREDGGREPPRTPTPSLPRNHVGVKSHPRLMPTFGGRVVDLNYPRRLRERESSSSSRRTDVEGRDTVQSAACRSERREVAGDRSEKKWKAEAERKKEWEARRNQQQVESEEEEQVPTRRKDVFLTERENGGRESSRKPTPPSLPPNHLGTNPRLMPSFGGRVVNLNCPYREPARTSSSPSAFPLSHHGMQWPAGGPLPTFGGQPVKGMFYGRPRERESSAAPSTQDIVARRPTAALGPPNPAPAGRVPPGNAARPEVVVRSAKISILDGKERGDRRTGEIGSRQRHRAAQVGHDGVG